MITEGDCADIVDAIQELIDDRVRGYSQEYSRLELIKLLKSLLIEKEDHG